jgi:hypothetical protein
MTVFDEASDTVIRDDYPPYSTFPLSSDRLKTLYEQAVNVELIPLGGVQCKNETIEAKQKVECNQ